MANDGWLTATEATRRLGVKPQTLYAYVSRGLVRRERPAGSRTSRYARGDVERLATHSRPRSTGRGPEILVDQARPRARPRAVAARRSRVGGVDACSARHRIDMVGSVSPAAHGIGDGGRPAARRRIRVRAHAAARRGDDRPGAGGGPRDARRPTRARVRACRLRGT